jgi:hypothetical protein
VKSDGSLKVFRASQDTQTGAGLDYIHVLIPLDPASVKLFAGQLDGRPKRNLCGDPVAHFDFFIVHVARVGRDPGVRVKHVCQGSKEFLGQ